MVEFLSKPCPCHSVLIIIFRLSQQILLRCIWRVQRVVFLIFNKLNVKVWNAKIYYCIRYCNWWHVILQVIHRFFPVTLGLFLFHLCIQYFQPWFSNSRVLFRYCYHSDCALTHQDQQNAQKKKKTEKMDHSLPWLLILYCRLDNFSFILNTPKRRFIKKYI